MQLSKIRLGQSAKIGGFTEYWWDLTQPRYKGWTARLNPEFNAILVTPKSRSSKHDAVYIPLVNVAFFVEAEQDDQQKTQYTAQAATPSSPGTRRKAKPEA